jgi:hypothetical protein
MLPNQNPNVAKGFKNNYCKKNLMTYSFFFLGAFGQKVCTKEKMIPTY